MEKKKITVKYYQSELVILFCVWTQAKELKSEQIIEEIIIRKKYYPQILHILKKNEFEIYLTYT